MNLPALPETMRPAFETICDLARERHVLLVGPPGVGKTMLARRVAAALPVDAATRWEIGVTWWWAFGGPGYMRHVAENVKYGLPAPHPFEPRIPSGPIFRAPHHTAAGLLGGGAPVRPGEVSLAHGGTLFIDELPEFSRHALEGLRHVLDTGSVRHCHRGVAYELPARFRLIAAMNPCPCGYLGHPERAKGAFIRSCVCPDAVVKRYVARVSAIADRSDVVVVRLVAHPGSALEAEVVIRPEAVTLKAEVR